MRTGTFAAEACISAHGGYTDSYGQTDVPAGALVYFYEPFNSSQGDDRARRIMQGVSANELRPNSIAKGGKVHDYHLGKFETDPTNVPRDLDSIAVYNDLWDTAKSAGQPTPLDRKAERDVITLRNRKEFSAFWLTGVPLSHIFEEVPKTHAYTAYHVCFCRWVAKAAVGGMLLF